MPRLWHNVRMNSLRAVGRRWRWWLPAIVILLGLVWIDHILLSPAVGHSEKPLLMSASPRPSASATPPATAENNRYYELDLPPGYTPQATTQPTGLLLAQTILKPGPAGTLIITIGVSDLPAGGLNANSSYALRVHTPDTYSLSQLKGTTVFTRTDGVNGEVVAFWVHGDRLATISVTDGVSNAGGGDTVVDRATLQTIIESWHWR